METRDKAVSLVGYLLLVAMALALIAGVMASSENSDGRHPQRRPTEINMTTDEWRSYVRFWGGFGGRDSGQHTTIVERDRTSSARQLDALIMKDKAAVSAAVLSLARAVTGS